MGELELRISDHDRDCAAAVLHAAVGEGRLTWAEHEEQLARVYAARTGADLTPCLADLPPTSRTWAAVRPAAPPLRVVLSKVRQRPDPAVGRVEVGVTLGAAVLDLRDLPAGSELEVVAHSLLGKVEIHISPGTRLVDTGTASLGKRSTVEHRRLRRDPAMALRPDAPVVRLRGHSVLGHVRVTVG